jgi:hypothetical protein
VWSQLRALDHFPPGVLRPHRTQILFATACVRRAWHLLTEPQLRATVELAEAVADGVASVGKFATATTALRSDSRFERYTFDPAMPREQTEAGRAVRALAELVLHARSTDSAWAFQAATHAAEAIVAGCCPQREWWTFELPPELERYRESARKWHWGMRLKLGDPVDRTIKTLREAADNYFPAAKAAEDAVGCDILRDMLHYPDQPVRFDAAWRTDTAVKLAEYMYENCDFSAMPILGDALQDAGCAETDIIALCQTDKPHVRGCWVVDLVLDRDGS